MRGASDTSGYHYENAECSCAHSYLISAVRKELGRLRESNDAARLFDLGCGNGSIGAVLHQDGWDVIGVDPSHEGIEQARRSYPNLTFELGSGYEDLAERFGRFPVVISLEVVEHVYAPRDYAQSLHDLLEPGGTAIVSTPYHGYLKNLALALTGKMDEHFTALWDHGHIKFWSIRTLTVLLLEAGFEDIRFLRVGRIQWLAKSMIAIARKPAD